MTEPTNTFRCPIEIGPTDGSRFQRVIVVAGSENIYSVLPSTLLEMFGVAATLEDPRPSIFQAYEALRLEATDPAPIEAVLREALKTWPESFILMHVLQDVLKARVAIAEAGADESAGPLGDTFEAVARIVRIWPCWDQAREIHDRMAA